MARPDFELLSEHARRQYGAFDRRQMLEVGACDKSIARLRSAGVIVGLDDGVYAFGGTPLTTELRLSAALLAAGEDAGLARLCAARWLGVWHSPVPTQILVPKPIGARPGGAEVYYSRNVLDDDMVAHRGLRVCSPHRILLDLAGALTDRWLRFVLDEMVRLDLTTPSTVIERCRQTPNRKRADVLRFMASTVPAAIDAHDSPLETAFARLCDDHGIPRPVHHYVVSTRERIYELDFCWPDLGVAVETDGGDHDRSEQRSFDRRRDEDLGAAGIRVIRLRWRDVTERPSKAVTLLRHKAPELFADVRENWR